MGRMFTLDVNMHEVQELWLIWTYGISVSVM